MKKQVFEVHGEYAAAVALATPTTAGQPAAAAVGSGDGSLYIFGLGGMDMQGEQAHREGGTGSRYSERAKYQRGQMCRAHGKAVSTVSWASPVLLWSASMDKSICCWTAVDGGAWRCSRRWAQVIPPGVLTFTACSECGTQSSAQNDFS